MNVHKSFGNTPVLSGVNLSIFQGEITAIIGKSGTGKSVLLKHIIGLMEADGGQILHQGQPLQDLPKKELEKFKRNLSYMFQDNALFDFMTVFENIALPLKEARRMPMAVIREKVGQRMEQLGLGGTQDK
ncbi:MAG: ATP-binding cassette domain-containing protein, partial [Desulfovibrionales bacterium]|nr:ATP-binding cassette domain-containing protein [Desulfovibrionales bacterium]